MIFRFRKLRAKEWMYLEAPNRLEGNRRAAIVLGRVKFDFEGVIGGTPEGALWATKVATVRYAFCGIPTTVEQVEAAEAATGRIAL